MNLSNTLLVATALLTSTAAHSGGDPVYDNYGVITIPRVDTADQVGQYQDVAFQYVSQGSWTISGLQMLGVGKLRQAWVDEVEVIKSGTLPVNVYLRARGNQGSCAFVGPARVHQRLEGSRFELQISAVYMYDPLEVVCAAVVRPFKMTIPLQVYGLNAGTYSYKVSGVTGTFSLEADNRFPDDCDAASNTICH